MDERRSPALEALFWREEILQVLFWMQGEQLAESVRCRDLQPLLQAEAATIADHLERCTREGLLRKTTGGDDEPAYSLSEKGREEGGRLFADAFAGMQKQGHGECTPDCDCHWEGHEHCPTHGPHSHA